MCILFFFAVLLQRKKIRRKKKSAEIFRKKIFGVKNSKVANRLKRVLPKFRADRSYVRGLNRRLKFPKNSFHHLILFRLIWNVTVSLV